MSSGIYTALSGAVAKETSLNIAANNIANMSTVGYRPDRLTFKEVLMPTNPIDPEQGMRGVVVDEQFTVTVQGRLRQTDGALDLALSGPGFFAIDTPEGERFTRSGSFTRGANGEIMTHNGQALQSQGGGTLVVPRNVAEIQIASDGTVTGDGTQIGTIRVVEFENVDALEKQGLVLYKASDDNPPIDAEETSMMQGFLEYPKPNGVSGMMGLITISRQFEAFQKVIQTYKKLDSSTATKIGGAR